MKWLLLIVLFFIGVWLIYYLMFSIPYAVKKTKELAEKHREWLPFTIAMIVLIVAFIVGVVSEL